MSADSQQGFGGRGVAVGEEYIPGIVKSKQLALNIDEKVTLVKMMKSLRSIHNIEKNSRSGISKQSIAFT